MCLQQPQNQGVFCNGTILVIRPHLLGENAQGIYDLTSENIKGKKKCWKMKMKKRKKNQVDEKVKEVRENVQLHAT